MFSIHLLLDSTNGNIDMFALSEGRLPLAK